MYLLCICTSPHDYIRSRFHKNNCNDPSNESHTWPACETKQLSKFQSKHENRLTTKDSCFVSSSDQNNFHFLHSPGRLHWLNTCSAQTLPQLQLKPRMLPDASEKSRPTFPNRRCLHVISLSIRCQPTVSTPSSTVHSVPWRFLLLSLSLSTPVPILPGKTTLLQASVSRSPVQTSVKPHCSCTLPNLRCSATHVLSPNYTNFSSHTCGNPILSWTKVIDKAKIWPSRLSCHSFSFLLPPPGMTPGSVAPRTVHSVRPGSTTTWPTCRDVFNFFHVTFL